MKKAFAENLKEFREDKKLSQTALAKMVGVTQQCVSEWEKEKTEPTLSCLIKLADIFQISLDELSGRDFK